MKDMEIQAVWEVKSGEDGEYWQLGRKHGPVEDRWVCGSITERVIEPDGHSRILVLDEAGSPRASLPLAFVVVTFRPKPELI